MLDLRTQEGRYARDICDGIAADLGGAPNAAQQILCQMFALKVLRVQLLVKAGDRGAAVAAVGAAVEQVARSASRRGVSVSVDVDPVT